MKKMYSRMATVAVAMMMTTAMHAESTDRLLCLSQMIITYIDPARNGPFPRYGV